MSPGRGVCPRCGKAGYGPYVKMTRNRPSGRVYRRYAYFMHRATVGDRAAVTTWCYIGRLDLGTLRGESPNRVHGRGGGDPPDRELPVLRPRDRGPSLCSDPLRRGCRGPVHLEVQVDGRPWPVCERCWSLILEGGYEW